MSEEGNKTVLKTLTSEEVKVVALNAKANELPRPRPLTLPEIADEIEKYHVSQHLKQEPAVAAATYLRVRELRHDAWMAYLATSGKPFRDRKVYDLIIELANIDDMTWVDVPVDQLRKSPDLLCMVGGTIYIGDVAVSSRSNEVREEKMQKYADITHMFKKTGYHVVEAYFILDTNLYNLPSEIDNLKHKGVKVVGMPPRIIHNKCGNIMRSLQENCTEKGVMLRLVSNDARTHVVECPIPDYWPNEEVEPISAVESEDEIILNLKNFVTANIDTYFDKDYSDAAAAFKKLWHELSNKDEASYMRARATIPVVYNCMDYEEKRGHDLVYDYVEDININADDSELRHFLLAILPARTQVAAMKNKEPNTSQSTYGEWQYKPDTSCTDMGRKLREDLSWNKSHPNDKRQARSVHPATYKQCYDKIENMIDYLSQPSNKPSIFKGQWQAKTHEEGLKSGAAKRVFEEVATSNGAQLCMALNMVCQRLNHLPTKLGQKTNIIVPPNGAFVMMLFEGHPVLTDSKCAVPFMTICRYKKHSNASHLEFQYKLSTRNYDYYISKCARLPLDKIGLWDQCEFTALSTIACLIEVTGNTMDEIMRKRTMGTLIILMVDSHQKTSELLELIKYVSFMPFANASRLSKFILDKMNLLTKTALDIWVLKKLEEFMFKLSKDVVAGKRRVMVSMGKVTEDSYGMDVKLPSFLSGFTHSSIRSYTEETAVLFNIRGKKLYGSQFLDKSLTASVDFEILYKEEKAKYGSWITEGVPNYPGEPYPFEAKFAHSRSAVVLGTTYVEDEYPIDTNMALNDIRKSDMNQHLIHSSTLRGSLKEKDDRQTLKDFGSTSLDEGLKFLEKTGYRDDLTITHQIAYYALMREKYIAQYSIAEKAQRGPGRPIATPTYLMKAVNICIERPEQAIGKQYRNNIIVPGVNKLQAQQDAYKDHMQKTIQLPTSCIIVQAAEDAQKFSESDDTAKFKHYARCSTALPAAIRKLQIKALEKMTDREHLVRRMPKAIETDIRLPYVNNDGNGVRLSAGWPQGMLNAMSTTLHSICDYYSVKLYKKAYPTDVIIVTGLVHSDDSWFVMSCENMHVFKKYMIFRTGLKRMFCLKLNDKKFWASSILGELVSNFNNNGDVSIPIMKTINSGTQNLMYQSYPMDVSTQVSTLQQLLRNGASNNVLIIMWTVLKEQLMKCYNIKDDPDNDKYPIELGGVPNCAAFELAMTGVVCHYNEIYKFYTRNESHPVTKLILKILHLSKMVNMDKMEQAMLDAKMYTSKYKPVEDDTLETFNSISLMHRNEVFSAITQLMPKTKKVEKTVARVKAIPFETDGLEMLVTRPSDITVALGHIKAKLPSILFEFASENYTSSARRMASVQAIRAQGRNYRLLKSPAITREELIDHVNNNYVKQANVVDLKVAFNDDTGIVDIAHHTVFNSLIVPNTEPKRYKINRFPNFNTKFDVTSNLKDCLLWGVSQSHPTAARYISTNYSDAVLRADFELIKNRFSQFFKMYSTRQACEYIIMMSWDAIKARLFVQPGIDRTNVSSFTTSLYGSIVDYDKCNSVIIDSRNGSPDVISNAIITTIHSAYVLSALYPDVEPTSYNESSLVEVVKNTDFASLTKHNGIRKAIIGLIHNDREPMDYLYKNREVSFRWLRAQEKVGSKWIGSFRWIGHYQGVFLRVEGVPKNINITVNKPEVDKILHMMKFLVDSAFPEYSYRDASNWSKSEFWITALPVSTLRMVQETPIETKIVPKFHQNGLDIYVNPLLSAIMEKDKSNPDHYELDANNTKVYAVTGTSRVQVARVPQTLSMPNSKKMGYRCKTLQGMEVQELMETNILLDLTLGKRVTPSPSAIANIIRTAQFDFKKVARNFLRNFINCVTNKDFELEDITDMTSQHDTTSLVLVPLTATEYIDAAQVAPEVVDPMYLDETDEKGGLKREGGFRAVKAILHTICVNEYLDSTEMSPESVVFNYSRSNEIIDACLKINKDDTITDVTYNLSDEICMTIFGNSLHDPEKWRIDAIGAMQLHRQPSAKCVQFLKTILSELINVDRTRDKAIKILKGTYVANVSESSGTPDPEVEESFNFVDSDDDIEDFA